jgi:YggT family protein
MSTDFLSDSTIIYAAADSTVNVVRPVLDIFINTLSVLFLARVILSWYPKTNLKEFPYSALVWPTEPLLEPVRSLVPPV